MGAMVEQHYAVLRKGISDEGVKLPEWSVRLSGRETPLAAFGARIQTFVKNLQAPLQGLWVCWLPAAVADGAGWAKAVESLLQLQLPPGVRLLFAEAKGGPVEKALSPLGDNAVILTFQVEGKEMMDYFRALSSPSSKSAGPPHPGTMPGCARPDVEPPPRRFGPKQSSEDDLQAAIAAGKVPPTLLPSQGAELRHLILEAATAAGENRAEDALRFQQAACALCAEAHAKLEQAMMTLVLASYLNQFKKPDQAGEEYGEAAALAEESGAYPQVAQARLAYAYFLLMARKTDLAAAQYERAAEAALKGKTTMLRIEALRMAGTCHLQRGNQDDTIRCWQSALDTGKGASAGEIRNSSFAEVGAALAKLLREQRMSDQARSVETQISAVESRVRKELAEAKT
jgi:tetratricopeptide (TPR) repeat protein